MKRSATTTNVSAKVTRAIEKSTAMSLSSKGALAQQQPGQVRVVPKAK